MKEAVAAAVAFLAVLAWTSGTEAQATVSLETEPCAVLPFDPARVSALVALELELDGLTLVPQGGDIVLRYAPSECALGVTHFSLEAVRAGERQIGSALLDEVALAAVPRALALHLVEMLRQSEGGPPNPAVGAAAPNEPAAPSEPAAPADSDSAPADSAPADTAPADTAPADTAPATPELGDSDFPAGDPEPAEAPNARSPFRLGAALHVRNTPDSGAFLGGGRVVLDLGFGHDLPLAMRVDAGFAVGMARGDVTLGVVDAGVGLFLRAVAADMLDLRFGPRLSVGHAFHIGDAVRRSEDVQVAAGLRVGGGIRVADGVDLLLEAEVGANLVDLELEVDGQRSGLVGAYWSADVGLAFDL